MVRVCDAIMGSGKSSAAINFMNEHPEQKFIYITPYKDEAWRIATACRATEFYYPEQKNEYSWSKVRHTMDLVSQGKSVATTHQAFKFYPPEMVDLIREQHYTLIIDESLESIGTLEEDPDDIQMAVDAGYLTPIDEDDEDGRLVMGKDVYRGKTFSELFRIARTRELIKMEWKNQNTIYYWQIPESLFSAFDDVYILTYLFGGQGMSSYMKMYNIQYTYIGVSRYEDGSYHFNFDGEGNYTPEYVKHLPDLLHIIDGKRINSIGDDDHTLTKTWYGKKENAKGVTQMRRNLKNLFYNILKADPLENRAYSVYKDTQKKMDQKGLTDAFIPFNERATNKYRNKTALAYCLNVHPNVNLQTFFRKHDVELNEDLYALSNMIQWIWRSAIRDGKPISLYVPSKRMRTLLTDWMEEVSSSADV